MSTIRKSELFDYMQAHKLAVIATVNSALAPEAALVGVAVTENLELVFDTLASTRKHANLLVRPRIAVTFSGPREQTLQYEGLAFPISASSLTDVHYLEAYYATWPDGPERSTWDGLVYWGVAPMWARYSDFDRGPLIAEFYWSGIVRNKDS